MPVRRTTILLDSDLYQRLESFAHRERTTKTTVIAAALEAYLDQRERPPEFPFVAIGRSANRRLSLDGRAIVQRELARRDRSGG
jgi:hypothetical protein